MNISEFIEFQEYDLKISKLIKENYPDCEVWLGHEGEYSFVIERCEKRCTVDGPVSCPSINVYGNYPNSIVKVVQFNELIPAIQEFLR